MSTCEHGSVNFKSCMLLILSLFGGGGWGEQACTHELEIFFHLHRFCVWGLV